MADNDFTKQYSDGTTLNESQLDTAYKSLKPALANFTSATAGSTSGQVLKSNGSSAVPEFDDIDDIIERKGPNVVYNYGLATSAAAGALTISLKTAAGSDPSSNDPVEIGYGGSGTISANSQFISIESAKSITIPASATLGVSGTAASKIYVYITDQSGGGGSVALAVSRSSRFDNGDAVNLIAIDSSADDEDSVYADSGLDAITRLIGYVLVAKNSSEEWQTPTEVRLSDNADYRNSPDATAILSASGESGADSIFQNLGRSTGTTVTSPDIALSNSSGSYSNTTTSFIDITNLSVTITTTGRPVKVELVPDGTVESSPTITTTTGVRCLSDNALGVSVFVLERNSSDVGQCLIEHRDNTGSGSNSIILPPNLISFIDTPSAGTHTYLVKARNTGLGDSTVVIDVKLLVYEL